MKQQRITRNIMPHCSIVLAASYSAMLLFCSPTHAGGDRRRDICDLISCSGAALGPRTCKLFDLTPHSNGPINCIGCGTAAATTITHNNLTLLSLLERTDDAPLDARQDGMLGIYTRYATSSEPDAVRELVQSRDNINPAITTMEARQERQDALAVDADVRLCPPAGAICTSLLLLYGTWANRTGEKQAADNFVGMLPYRSSEYLHPPVITTPTALYHFTARPEQFSRQSAASGILCRQLDDGSHRIVTTLTHDTLVVVGNTPFWQELSEATTYNGKPAPTNELALCRALCQHCTQVHTRQTDQNIATRLALALQRHARQLRYKRSQPICFFVMQRHCPDRRRTSWFHSIEQHPIAPPVRATSPTDTDTASACASPTPATHRMRPETDKRPGTTDAATTIAPARPMQRAKHSRQLEHAEQIPNRRQAATLAEQLGLRAFGSSPITAEQLVQELRLPTTVPCPPAAAGGDDGTPHPKRRKKKHAMPTIYEETMPWQHNMTEWGPISSFTVSTWLLGSRFSLEFDLVAAATTPECAPSPEAS